MHSLFCKELLWVTVSSERCYNTLFFLNVIIIFCSVLSGATGFSCFILNMHCLVFLEPFFKFSDIPAKQSKQTHQQSSNGFLHCSLIFFFNLFLSVCIIKKQRESLFSYLKYFRKKYLEEGILSYSLDTSITVYLGSYEWISVPNFPISHSPVGFP